MAQLDHARKLEIAERLRGLRERDPAVKQPHVAEATGVSLRTAQAWEAGASTPKWDHAEALAKFYEVDVDWLMGRTEAEKVGPTPALPGAIQRVEAMFAEILTRLDELSASSRMYQKSNASTNASTAWKRRSSSGPWLEEPPLRRRTAATAAALSGCDIRHILHEMPDMIGPNRTVQRHPSTALLADRPPMSADASVSGDLAPGRDRWLREARAGQELENVRPNGARESRRHGVAYLLILGSGRSLKPDFGREALKRSALVDGQATRFVRMD